MLQNLDACNFLHNPLVFAFGTPMFQLKLTIFSWECSSWLKAWYLNGHPLESFCTYVTHRTQSSHKYVLDVDDEMPGLGTGSVCALHSHNVIVH